MRALYDLARRRLAIPDALWPLPPLIMARVARIALRSLSAYRLRSAFVSGAVALGIASLTVIVAAMDGAARKAEELADVFGPNAIVVVGGTLMYQPMGTRPQTMTWGDITLIRQTLPGVISADPYILRENVSAKANGRTYEVAQVIGAGADYQASFNWPLLAGNDLTAEDVEAARNTCIIGTIVADKLFGRKTPLGEHISLNGQPYVVKGVLTPRNLIGAGVEQDDRVVLPAKTMLSRFNMDRKHMTGVRINFSSSRGMQGNTDRVRELLRFSHGIGPDRPDDFLILSPLVVLQFVNFLKGGFGFFLGVTAISALLVSGFILANLLHLSVSERQMEIGMKKALGATNKAILLQFLLEALGMTLVGAVAGIGLGAALACLLETKDLLTLKLSFGAFASAFIAATTVALFFGMRPARRAASLQPIHALKGEG